MVDAQGVKLRYTSSQRGSDTLTLERSSKVLHSRSRPVVDGRPAAISLERDMQRNGLSPKTCIISRFRLYIAFRESSRDVFQDTYARPVFRGMRFLAWSRRSASMEGFVKRILEKYGDHNQTVVIFYGNWGRQPNLRHQAPSPGIGLRRLIHAVQGIVTITVNEAYTSSFCARHGCLGEVACARGAHGLLRCSSCGTRWSRDVLGARNILAKAMHFMEHHGPHPVMGG